MLSNNNMAIKTWKVEVELFWSANHVATIYVEANTQRKAYELARQKAIKESDWDHPIILSIKEVNV